MAKHKNSAAIQSAAAPINVTDASNAVEDAINALYKIHRLADRTEGELDDRNADGRIFIEHIQALCIRHGKQLQQVYRQLSGSARVGMFDRWQESDAAIPAGRFYDSDEAHHA